MSIRGLAPATIAALTLILSGCGNERLFSGPPAVVNASGGPLVLELTSGCADSYARIESTVPTDGYIRLSPISLDWKTGTVTLLYRRAGEPESAVRSAIIACGRPIEVISQSGELVLRDLVKDSKDLRFGFPDTSAIEEIHPERGTP